MIIMQILNSFPIEPGIWIGFAVIDSLRAFLQLEAWRLHPLAHRRATGSVRGTPKLLTVAAELYYHLVQMTA
jgi:hypothetical protein